MFLENNSEKLRKQKYNYANLGVFKEGEVVNMGEFVECVGRSTIFILRI
jgi:hypothetical protein